jgi:hypothetical protein
MKTRDILLAAAFTILTWVVGSTPVQAQQTGPTDEAKIADAMSAGPASVAEDATVMDWPATEGGEMTVLREGSSGWVCYPSNPAVLEAGYRDPMCLDEVWQGWLEALMTGSEPTVERTGVGYMFQGDGGTSNVSPADTGPTADNDWHVAGPHLMVLTSDPSELEGVPTDPHNGGPYVMWAGTPYAHIMVPTGPYPEK